MPARFVACEGAKAGLKLGAWAAEVRISMTEISLNDLITISRFDHYQSFKKILSIEKRRFLPPIH
jgi:hypothetical protein